MTGKKQVSLLLLILFFSTFLSWECMEVKASMDNLNFQDIENCRGKKIIEEKLHCLKGIIFSKNKQIREREEAFSSLIKYWQKRDGGEGPEISDAFLDILLTDYRFFFNQMTKFQLEFDDWLIKLQNMSFVWYQGPPSPLDKKRMEIIDYLEKIKDLTGEADIFRTKLVDKLKSIKPRQID